MYKLRFVADYEVKDEAGTMIKAGDELEVDNVASRDRWLRRGVAVLVDNSDKSRAASGVKTGKKQSTKKKD